MSDWTGMGPNAPAPKLDPNCQCICHSQPGVMHVAACCSAPPMTAARDDLAALRIRVKPLVWEDQPGGSYCWTQGLHYYTEGSDAEQDWYVSCMIYDDDVWQGDNQSTREAAKAAAEADYEARILAALDVEPGALKARA